MTDDELMEAWRRGELVVTDVDDETRTRILAALVTPSSVEGKP
jgi:hypothetical protein